METGSHPDFRFVLPAAMAALKPGFAEEEGDENTESREESAETTKPARASREIRIEQIRALSSFAAVASHRAGARVVLLAPAETLNAPAANALLKLLEEPPTGMMFLLATDALDELAPTIRSRCVLMRIEPPPAEPAMAWLKQQGIEDSPARLAAAGGAPLAAWEDAAGALDPQLRALLLELLARGAALEPAHIARSIPRELPVGPALGVLQRWCWDLLAYRATGKLRYHLSQQRVIAGLVRNVSVQRLLTWWKSLCNAQATRDHPLNSRLVLEAALLEYIASVSEQQ